MKKGRRGIGIVLSCVILCVVLFGSCFEVTTITDIGDYSGRLETPYFDNVKQVMPELNSLPSYEAIEYFYQRRQNGVFPFETILLKISFDAEAFQQKQKSIEETIPFLNTSIESIHNSEKYVIPEHEFSIGSFVFKVVDTGRYSYPHDFGMIAFSHQEKSIVYLYYRDTELNYIDSMPKFVQKAYSHAW